MPFDSTTRERLLYALLLITVVVAASAWTLSFPWTPEGWSQVSLFRERSVLGALQPFEEYPYYRPLWFLWLSFSDRMGWAAAGAHSGPLGLHVAGCLAVFASLWRFGAQRAFWVALTIGIAPGLAGALSWLEAGNKAFVFFFLAIAVFVLTRFRGVAAYPLAIVCGAVPATFSSENGYLACCLLPLVILTLRPREFDGRAQRIVGAVVVTLLSAAISLWHLLVLSPQRESGADNRVAQLAGHWREDPVSAASAFFENIGRFFLHGIGVADNAPLVGAIVLAMLFSVALVLRWRAVLLAFAVFVVLNVPASFFVDESSRHHAYLPAIGAACIVTTTLQRFAASQLTLPAIALFFCARGFEAQRPWADYCHHSARVYASCVEVMPKLPLSQPVLVNVPEEYRAAFHLHLGADAEVAKWPAMTVLSSRSEVLLPRDWQPPKGSERALVIEYDGRVLKRSSMAEIAQRKRAPALWWEPEVRAFERPWLAWGESLSLPGRLVGSARSFAAATLKSEPGREQAVATRGVVLEEHGLLPKGPGMFWECEIDAGEPGWLVLGWTPWTALPTTENAWIFTLAPLPWLFELAIFERSASGRELLPLATHPVYGFLPAAWCDGSGRRLRFELRIRGV